MASRHPWHCLGCRRQTGRCRTERGSQTGQTSPRQSLSVSQSEVKRTFASFSRLLLIKVMPMKSEMPPEVLRHTTARLDRPPLTDAAAAAE